jgi:hypothetical protein
MTPSQVEEVLVRYQETLLIQGAKPIRHKTAAILPSKADAINHALWMCEQVQGFDLNEHWEKAMRWLGFIQAILWCHGVASIDSMKEDNR